MTSSSKKYQNLEKVTIISIGFFLTFTGTGSSANLAAKAQQDNGFDSLGLYQNATAYFIYIVSSFFGTAFVKKFGSKLTLFFGAACYLINIIEQILPALYAQQPENRDKQFYFRKGFIYSMGILAGVINGIGSGVIWTAQGEYVSNCANDENKGFFFSYFYFIYMSSQIAGNIIAAIVLENSQLTTYYIVMSIIMVVGCLLFLFLQKPIKSQTDILKSARCSGHFQYANFQKNGLYAAFNDFNRYQCNNIHW
ncbi:major facilitator superfamily protein [Stylonychia lemnae]|uniref:Major facilitator superfamily protein n=1 Tax=Stylonychia lemnae TaxID=5949 RepID=A0A078AXX2_STYLE|nr:major facilitator superfamily protein [Stylonychia lemnae]|eukprot:CDW87024.1 major facilitator superfamily protein [Stylonychia lemnae]